MKVGLVGNPNVGKSTIFNNLTGMHQHTGNWPGKTVVKASGIKKYKCKEYQYTCRTFVVHDRYCFGE